MAYNHNPPLLSPTTGLSLEILYCLKALKTLTLLKDALHRMVFPH